MPYTRITFQLADNQPSEAMESFEDYLVDTYPTGEWAMIDEVSEPPGFRVFEFIVDDVEAAREFVQSAAEFNKLTVGKVTTAPSSAEEFEAAEEEW